MKYLFFDIENANCLDDCAKMFSFGYVLADENLKILVDHTDVLINPEVDVWDWYVLKHMTAYSKHEICQNPNFPKRYTKLKRLLESDDTVAVGFSTLDDISYLMDGCKRYGVEPFNIKFFDIQKVCAKLNDSKITSLSSEYLVWCSKFAGNQHRSDYDALYTYEIAKAVCNKTCKTLQELMTSEDYSVGHTEDFAYGYDSDEILTKEKRKARSEQKKEDRLKRYLEKAQANGHGWRELKDAPQNLILRGSKNSVMFIRFLENVKINDDENGIFAHKKISISLNYEMYNFVNMIKLVQLIADNGGEYVKKATLSDYFVPYSCQDQNGDEIPDNKLKSVNEAIADGKEITILSFDALLGKLGITEDELNAMPEIDLSYLEDERYRREKIKK